MANYKKEGGTSVKTYSSDPPTSFPSAWEGQLYYNSSDGNFKFQTIGAGAWASGGAMPANKWVGFAAGTQTSNLVAGGATTPPANGNQVNTTFEYDGSSWTAGGAINTTRFDGAGFGASNTAALIASGGASPGSSRKTEVESYNGTAWTEVADVNTKGYGLRGVGISTAGLKFGGYDGSFTVNAETWDGSSWTEVGNLNTASTNKAGVGIQTAALAATGEYDTPDAITTNVEQWNGSAWTEIADVNTGRSYAAGSGTSTDGIIFGGTVPNGDKTEAWDGSSWTEVADLSTARIGGHGSPAGTGSVALYAGGGTPGGTTATEEWNKAHTLKKVTLG